jgi:L-methionine (R)-S-oxide reductase
VDHPAWVEDLVRRVAAAPSLDAALRIVVAELPARRPHFNWVGAYMIAPGGEELVLGPWQGPAATQHVRIPVGTGVCGAAAASGRTEVVDDVNADPRYLACFLNTRAELVVPIARAGRVYGEIDVDSDRPAAFGPADVAAVEAICAALAERCAAADHPYHVPRL